MSDEQPNHPTPNQTSHGPSDPPGQTDLTTTVNPSLTKEKEALDGIMEEFRAGDIRRFAATSAILSVLGDCDVSDEEKEKTVTLLLQEIGSRQPKDSTPPTHASTSTARKDARPQSPTKREKHQEEVDNLFKRLSKRSEPDKVDPDAGLP